MTGSANITRPETVQNSHEDDEGTGIYWLIDSDEKQEQIFVPGITQREAHELAKKLGGGDSFRTDAYRWVPDTVESASSLVASKCGGKCTDDLDCINNACRCIKGHCRRRSSR